MRGVPLFLGLLFAFAAALGCTAPRGGPQPARVVPARVDSLVDVAIEIEGSGFEALVTTDFRDGSGALDAGFTASLAPSGGGAAVPLPGVIFTVRRTLQATVPAGLPHVLYDLVVTDAAGRTGFLAGALRVATPAGTLAGFRVAPLPVQRAGGSFTVAITAVAEGGGVVDGFEGTVTLSDATGTLAPQQAGPFVAGELRVSAVVEALAEADVLQVVDAARHGGASPPFAVGPGLPVAVAFAATALSGAPAPASGRSRSRCWTNLAMQHLPRPSSAPCSRRTRPAPPSSSWTPGAVTRRARSSPSRAVRAAAKCLSARPREG